ncbi:MAG: ANTAR domain-containing protein [Eubacteriales bacterium]|nr:ANTAR domain-containing protein [Eubacteriales bacterium]
MNISIVVALPNIEDAKKIRGILVRFGYPVIKVCDTGARVLAAVSELDAGIVICGYHLKDMYYRDVAENLPDCFELLLLASARVVSEAPNSILTVELPMKSGDLVNTVEMMASQMQRKYKRDKRPRERTSKDRGDIDRAKLLLMERNHLSEEEAYRYIQKNSMDSQTNMVETAQMILVLLNDSV